MNPRGAGKGEERRRASQSKCVVLERIASKARAQDNVVPRGVLDDELGLSSDATQGLTCVVASEVWNDRHRQSSQDPKGYASSDSAKTRASQEQEQGERKHVVAAHEIDRLDEGDDIGEAHENRHRGG